MKIQCDVCEKAPASVICCADEAALCPKCDIEVHAANKLASKHPRLLLHSLSTKFPPCDICQEKVAFIFCVEDRALLCKGCDEAIHAANSHSANHQRFLATGIRVALSSSGCTKELDKELDKNQPEPPPYQQHNSKLASSKPPTHHQSTFVSSPWAVDDILQFSDLESADKKEQLDFGELEWLADIGIFNEQLHPETLPVAEVPELPLSPSNTFMSYRPFKSNEASRKKPRLGGINQDDDDDEQHFTVPDLG